MKFLDEKLVRHWEGVGRDLLLPSVAARDASATFDRAVWTRLIEMGAQGGGESYVEPNSIVYGLGKGSLDLPFCSSLGAHFAIATDLLATFGSPEQREKYLPQLQSGARVGTICNAEQGSGSDLRKMRSHVTAEPDGHLRVEAFKPCANNLSFAGLAFVSCWNDEKEIRLYLLEGEEIEQTRLHDQFASFRTGVVGSMRTSGLLLNRKERELPRAFFALRHCLHTERFYLGVLVAGILAGLEDGVVSRLLARETTFERQYLQEKIVNLRSARVRLEALLGHIFEITGSGKSWERAAIELCVLKTFLNTEAPKAVQNAFETMSFEGVFLSSHAQRVYRDLQALTFFGGTTELQKIQIFEDLARGEKKRNRLKKAA
ncbi:MAG TPA: acyl-CoA dehydrogenase family protein [Bdellovibrionota bacterium]